MTIPGTAYVDGQDVTREQQLNCPEKCLVPPGLRLVQVVPPGTSFSIRCPNECGLAIRFVEGKQ